MNLKTLTEQRADKQNEMETLLNKVEGEQRAFTDEENELFASLERDINSLSQTIESIKKGRELLVNELKQSLVEKAKGFQYSEKKIVRERNEVGDLVITREEEYIKYSPPDVAALNLLLKNYDKENWANDPQVIALRKKELELRERQIEAGEW